jgi:hypothetical protein
MDKFMRNLHDECVGVCERWLLYGELVCMSMLCAKYFCVSNFVHVMVHAAITNKIKLKITCLILDLLGGVNKNVVTTLNTHE